MSVCYLATEDLGCSTSRSVVKRVMIIPFDMFKATNSIIAGEENMFTSIDVIDSVTGSYPVAPAQAPIFLNTAILGATIETTTANTDYLIGWKHVLTNLIVDSHCPIGALTMDAITNQKWVCVLETSQTDNCKFIVLGSSSGLRVLETTQNAEAGGKYVFSLESSEGSSFSEPLNKMFYFENDNVTSLSRFNNKFTPIITM